MISKGTATAALSLFLTTVRVERLAPGCDVLVRMECTLILGSSHVVLGTIWISRKDECGIGKEGLGSVVVPPVAIGCYQGVPEVGTGSGLVMTVCLVEEPPA